MLYTLHLLLPTPPALAFLLPAHLCQESDKSESWQVEKLECWQIGKLAFWDSKMAVSWHVAKLANRHPENMPLGPLNEISDAPEPANLPLSE